MSHGTAPEGAGKIARRSRNQPSPQALVPAGYRSDRAAAIACMAGMADWRPAAPLLEPLVERVDIGLHLTLTGEAPLTVMPQLASDGRLPSINALIRASRRGELPLDEIEREIDAQFARFRAATGRRPDFVDGHQHFHALPDLREIVLAAHPEVDRLSRDLASSATHLVHTLVEINGAKEAGETCRRIMVLLRNREQIGAYTGTYTVTVSSMGFKDATQTVTIAEATPMRQRFFPACWNTVTKSATDWSSDLM